MRNRFAIKLGRIRLSGVRAMGKQKSGGCGGEGSETGGEQEKETWDDKRGGSAGG